jgi:hypothetical protein
MLRWASSKAEKTARKLMHGRRTTEWERMGKKESLKESLPALVRDVFYIFM